MIKYVRDEKVVYKGTVYDFGYYSQTGHCVIYKEGEKSLQDALAVQEYDISRLDPNKIPIEAIILYADEVHTNACKEQIRICRDFYNIPTGGDQPPFAPFLEPPKKEEF